MKLKQTASFIRIRASTGETSPPASPRRSRSSTRRQPDKERPHPVRESARMDQPLPQSPAASAPSAGQSLGNSQLSSPKNTTPSSTTVRFNLPNVKEK